MFCGWVRQKSNRLARHEKPSTLGNSQEIEIEVKELKNDEERNQN